MLSPVSGSHPVLKNETYFLIKLLKEIVDLLQELKTESVKSEDLCNSILEYVEHVRVG